MTWREVSHEEATAPLGPPELLGKRVRLSNPVSGVHVEGVCERVGLELTFSGTRAVFTLQPEDAARGDWELREPGADPMFATRLEVEA